MNEKLNVNLKKFNINDVFYFIKKHSKCKFIESVDVSINLSIDIKDSNQNICGSVIYPNSIKKKDIKIIVFAPKNLSEIAYKYGAYIVGTNDLFDKIKNKSIYYDLVLSVPESINIVSKLGSILGPKNLIPNLKSGTLTNDLKNTLLSFINGRVIYRNDRFGIIHSTIGKLNFTDIQLIDNFKVLISSINSNKPGKLKKNLIKKITISSTMGKGYVINLLNLSYCV